MTKKKKSEEGYLKDKNPSVIVVGGSTYMKIPKAFSQQNNKDYEILFNSKELILRRKR